MSTSTSERLDCSREMRWLREHRKEYAGQWVALDGDHLISYGTKAKEILAEARKSGVELPLFVHVEHTDELSFGGW